jgi:Poly(R)-hydroxyalkanoic acid synthase subunit (PHA_synth_III_E)
MANQQANQFFETWRRQLEEGTQAWARLVNQAPTPPPDPLAFWKPILDHGLQNWAKLFTQAPVTPDLLGQWKQFLDQWIEAWSRVLGQAMSTDAFAQLMGRSLDQWLAGQGPLKKSAEQSLDATLQALNLASRSQLTGVARQIVDLDERVERLEDTLGALRARVEHLVQLLSSSGAVAGSSRRAGDPG